MPTLACIKRADYRPDWSSPYKPVGNYQTVYCMTLSVEYALKAIEAEPAELSALMPRNAVSYPYIDVTGKLKVHSGNRRFTVVANDMATRSSFAFMINGDSTANCSSWQGG